MLEITPGIVIQDAELEFRYLLASGPGGQNVNKVATAVQLRFDTASPGLPGHARERLRNLAGRRLTRDGLIVLTARRYRTRERNRRDAIERLVTLLQQAVQRPKVRKKTRPSRAARERRLQAKRERAQRKANRRVELD